MTSPFIPEEAVTAARLAYANSIRAHYKFPPMSGVKNGDMENAAIEAAISAALPHLEKAIREDCAKAAEAELLESTPDNEADQAYNKAVHDCAAAIRARKE